MKIIFTDIDGVLNNYLHSKIKKMKNINSLDCLTKPLTKIDLHNLDILQLIVKKTNAKLVISSSWRKDICVVGRDSTAEQKTEKFIQLFSDLGWENAPIIGVTPSLSGFRGQEIATYLDNLELSLKETNETIEDYLILDDDSDFIYKELHETPIEHLNQMNLMDRDSQILKSKNWSNQKHILTNRLIGLSYDDLISILKLWEPTDLILKNHEDYLPYIHRYGKRF